MEAAKSWGMAPWQVEDAPALWMDRFAEWEAAKSERIISASKKGERGQVRQVGNKRIKRVI